MTFERFPYKIDDPYVRQGFFPEYEAESFRKPIPITQTGARNLQGLVEAENIAGELIVGKSIKLLSDIVDQRCENRQVVLAKPSNGYMYVLSSDVIDAADPKRINYDIPNENPEYDAEVFEKIVQDRKEGFFTLDLKSLKYLLNIETRTDMDSLTLHMNHAIPVYSKVTKRLRNGFFISGYDKVNGEIYPIQIKGFGDNYSYDDKKGTLQRAKKEILEHVDLL